MLVAVVVTAVVALAMPVALAMLIALTIQVVQVVVAFVLVEYHANLQGPPRKETPHGSDLLWALLGLT